MLGDETPVSRLICYKKPLQKERKNKTIRAYTNVGTHKENSNVRSIVATGCVNKKSFIFAKDSVRADLSLAFEKARAGLKEDATFVLSVFPSFLRPLPRAANDRTEIEVSAAAAVVLSPRSCSWATF